MTTNLYFLQVVLHRAKFKNLTVDTPGLAHSAHNVDLIKYLILIMTGSQHYSNNMLNLKFQFQMLRGLINPSETGVKFKNLVIGSSFNTKLATSLRHSYIANMLPVSKFQYWPSTILLKYLTIAPNVYSQPSFLCTFDKATFLVW